MAWRPALMVLALAACAGTDQPAPGASPAPAARAAASPAAPVRRPPSTPARPAAPEPRATVWRVRTDGTTACADRAALAALREQGEPDAAARRRLAAWRATGGCVTVFRAQSWRLVEVAGETLRLAPADQEGGATVHFWRDEVAEEPAG